MRSFRKFVLPTVCLVLSAGALCLEGEKDKAKDSAKSRDSEKKAGAADTGKTSKEPEKLAFPVAIGYDSVGLKLPSFGLDGKLKVLFNVGVATRVDENNVKMTNTQVQTYDEDGSPEMDIALPTSTFHLSTRVITTEQSVTISREDFELTGQTMAFNTETRTGTLGGGVKMVIFDLAQETGDDAKPAPDKARPPKSALPKVTLPPNEANRSIKVTKPKPAPTKGTKPRE